MRNLYARHGTLLLRASQAIWLGFLAVALFATVYALVAAAQGTPVWGTGDDRRVQPPGPDLGEPAPDFRLHSLHDDTYVSLQECLGRRRGIVLVFGSYT